MLLKFSANAWLKTTIAFFLLLLEISFLQGAANAYSSGYGGHPDEAAHFISSLLVHDFISQFALTNPMGFANDFYLHYPKVAIGNWPPMLYLVLALWFLIFGVTRVSALFFMAVLAAATATLIYIAGRKLLSGPAGLFAAVLYAAIPLVQESSAKVMTEHLVTFFIFLSTLLFARFFYHRTAVNALLFGFVAAAAIMTRGSAWALIVVPPVTILLTRDWKMLRDWRLWISTIPVTILCIPWYLATKGMSRGAMVGIDNAAPTAFFVEASTKFPLMVYESIGFVLACLAMVGLWLCIIRAKTKDQQFAFWAALLGMSVGILLIHSLVPAAIEGRYMMQLLPAVVLLASAGTAFLISKMPKTLHERVFATPLAWVGVAGMAVWTMFTVPDRIQNGGYEQVAARIAQETKGDLKRAVLLSSDSVGEGSMIAAIAVLENRPGTMMLRGSKIMAHEDWLGRGSKERFSTDASITEFLDAVPIRAVVVDKAIDDQWERPYHQRLEKLLAADTQRWRLDKTYTILRNGQPKPGPVSIYIRKTAPTEAWSENINKRLVLKLMQQD